MGYRLRYGRSGKKDPIEITVEVNADSIDDARRKLNVFILTLDPVSQRGLITLLNRGLDPDSDLVGIQKTLEDFDMDSYTINRFRENGEWKSRSTYVMEKEGEPNE